MNAKSDFYVIMQNWIKLVINRMLCYSVCVSCFSKLNLIYTLIPIHTHSGATYYTNNWFERNTILQELGSFQKSLIGVAEEEKYFKIFYAYTLDI